MNELALFSGGGGGLLAGKLLGWRTVCAVEKDSYCCRRIMQRQNEGNLAPFPIWDDVCTFDGRPWAGKVDIISAGFPCQDISVANDKGEGIDGEPVTSREHARIALAKQGRIESSWIKVCFNIKDWVHPRIYSIDRRVRIEKSEEKVACCSAHSNEKYQRMRSLSARVGVR